MGGRAAWGLVLWGAIAAPAWANDTRYGEIVVGARAAGMGGAFTAIADDSSGLIYNPAGLADVRRASLAVNTNLYGFHRASRGGVVTGLPQTGLPRAVEAEINVIPSSAGGVMGLGPLLPDGTHRFAIGFGLNVPSQRTDNVSEEILALGSGVRRNLRLSDRTLWAGIGAAMRLGESVRMGVAAHYVLRSLDGLDTITVVRTDEAGRADVYYADSSLRLQSGSLVGVLGVKIVATRNLAFGVSVATQGIQLHHNGEYAARIIRSTNDPNVPAVEALTVPINMGPEANLQGVGSRPPLTLRMGTAWTQHANWTLTLDGSLFLPVDYDLVPGNPALREGLVPAPTRIRRQAVFNAAVGYEKLVGRSLAFSAGAYTNFPSSPPLQSSAGILLASSSKLSRIPMAGLTFAAGLLSPFSITRVGFMSAFGVGELVSVRDRRAVAVDSPVEFRRATGTEWTFYVFISNTFRYGAGRDEALDFGLTSFLESFD